MRAVAFVPWGARASAADALAEGAAGADRYGAWVRAGLGAAEAVGWPEDVPGWVVGVSNIFQIFANFWRARSRLYQNENMHVNMRLTAFLKLYKICIFLHRCNLQILAKNRIEESEFVVKI